MMVRLQLGWGAESPLSSLQQPKLQLSGKGHYISAAREEQEGDPGWGARGRETTGFPTSESFNTESAFQKNSLEHMFSEISSLSCCREALGTPAFLEVTGRLPFSALRGDRTWLDLSTRDGAPEAVAPALSLSRHRL